MKKWIFTGMLAAGFCLAAEWAGAAGTNAPAGTNVPVVVAVSTNAPLSTNAPAAAIPAATGTVTAASDVRPPEPEWPWTGYVRVMMNASGEVQAIRLVAGARLLAVETDGKGRELAKMPKTRKVRIKGSLEERDGRSWLRVADFQDAPGNEAPVPAAPSAPAAVPAATNATVVAGTNAAVAKTVSTNAVSTNAVPVAGGQR
jgi:hypothetical protein